MCFPYLTSVKLDYMWISHFPIWYRKISNLSNLTHLHQRLHSMQVCAQEKHKSCHSRVPWDCLHRAHTRALLGGRCYWGVLSVLESPCSTCPSNSPWASKAPPAPPLSQTTGCRWARTPSFHPGTLKEKTKQKPTSHFIWHSQQCTTTKCPV